MFTSTNDGTIYNHSGTAGGIVGINDGGSIYRRINFGVINNSMNAGGVAGRSFGNLVRSSNRGRILHSHSGENGSSGGIVGIQACGHIDMNDNRWLIEYIDRPSDCTYLQPFMGQIIGNQKCGNALWNSLSGSVDTGTLRVVNGHDQALFARDDVAGRAHEFVCASDLDFTPSCTHG